ncbi:MAG: peptide chain release factor N(5)-glutamine methyltransferase [Atopostipes suicloacalis]|nr:peptide chain release factor N(5)-glutamine methyltransferase [Atopostipes suicloacalis]MDN6730803.1 peptide chain release factor N(5)-glutamine methyltransferase [Atopostipes suicloacalis]
MFEGREEPLSYFEVLKRASSFLTKNNYSTFAAEWLMRERLSWTKTDLIKNYQKKMSEDEREQFQRDLKELLQGKPMQQIIGHDWFYGRKFTLTKDTLIPRPETEEWLDQLLKRLPNRPLKVLDIGTGSGVLAITQKLERPEDNLTAIDISENAIKIAEKNAERLGADIQFIKSNLFEEITDQSYDLILSNPPYIAYNEKNLMDESVLNYEPKEALFAENEGLAIYEAIAASVSKYLNSPYYLALEIGYAQGTAVSKIFKEALAEANVEIWTDLNALDRLVFIYS